MSTFGRGRPSVGTARMRGHLEDCLAEAAIIELLDEHLIARGEHEAQLIALGTVSAVGKVEVLLARDREDEAAILEAVQVLQRATRTALDELGLPEALGAVLGAQHGALTDWVAERKAQKGSARRRAEAV